MRRDQRGMAFVELGLVLPILMFLLLGAVDMSRMITARMDLEKAAQRTTDFGLSSRPLNDDATYLVDEAVRATGLPRDQITAQIFLECNGVRQSDFDGGCTSGQTRARYISVEISDHVDPFFNWTGMAKLVGSSDFNNGFTVAGDSTVRFQ